MPGAYFIRYIVHETDQGMSRTFLENILMKKNHLIFRFYCHPSSNCVISTNTVPWHDICMLWSDNWESDYCSINWPLNFEIWLNSLAPGRCGSNLERIIFSNGKSTLVQVMNWYEDITSHHQWIGPWPLFDHRDSFHTWFVGSKFKSFWIFCALMLILLI